MSRTSKRAFTLVELLVVITVITILLLLTLSVTNTIKSSARRLVCANNLRQLAMSYMLYANNYRNRLPVATTSNTVQFNYTILSGSFVSGMGLIANECEVPITTFYCPSIAYQPNQGYWFDSGSNPAPNPLYPLQTNYVGNFRAGYSLFWGVYGAPMPMWGKKVTSYNPTTGAPSNPASYPVYNDQLPIMSDFAGQRASMAPQHLTGTNVVFGGGRVQWILFSRIKTQYDALPFNGYARTNNLLMEAYYIAIGKL